MNDVVGTAPEEHLMSDLEHMEDQSVLDGCGGVARNEIQSTFRVLRSPRPAGASRYESVQSS